MIPKNRIILNSLVYEFAIHDPYVNMKQIKFRVIIVGIAFTLFFTIIGAKAMYLQIVCRLLAVRKSRKPI